MSQSKTLPSLRSVCHSRKRVTHTATAPSGVKEPKEKLPPPAHMEAGIRENVSEDEVLQWLPEFSRGREDEKGQAGGWHDHACRHRVKPECAICGFSPENSAQALDKKKTVLQV